MTKNILCAAGLAFALTLGGCATTGATAASPTATTKKGCKLDCKKSCCAKKEAAKKGCCGGCKKKKG